MEAAIATPIGTTGCRTRKALKAMTSARKTAIVVGALFLTATASYLVGSALIGSAVTTGNLATLNATHVRLGVFFEFINADAVIGIGVFVLPVLRKHREGMALGYLATEIIQSALCLVSALCALLLLPVGREYLDAHGSRAAQLQNSATLARDGYHLAFQLGMVALGLGSLLFCYILYEARLVPRALSVLGFVGYIALFVSGWLEIAGQQHTVASALYIPGALFEFILPLVLIVKGFNESGVTAGPRSAARSVGRVVGADPLAAESGR